jgi:hypothetical protein
MALIPVTINFTEYNTDSQWNQPFNQVLFENFDASASVWINGTELKANQAKAICLNVTEYNTTLFNFSFRGSAGAKLVITYTLYNNIKANVNSGV